MGCRVRERSELLYLRGDESTDMRHVAEQQRTDLVGDGPEPGVVPVPRVGAAPADDELRAEVHGLLLELLVVYVPSGGADLVRQALEVDRGGGDLLPAGGVVAVREVATRGEVEPHDPVVRVEQRSVGSEVRGRSRVGLHVDAPGGGVEAERGERAGPAEVLDLVDDLVAAVVARPRHALRVLVGERGAERLHDGEGGEVLRGDELDAAPLTPLLPLQEVVDDGVGGLEGGQTPRRDGVHGGGGDGGEAAEGQGAEERRWGAVNGGGGAGIYSGGGGGEEGVCAHVAVARGRWWWVWCG
jgi:hypothetical protein